MEVAAWLEKVKVADEANEASAQKQEMDSNAEAAKETKEKEGSTTNSQERNEEEFTKATTRLGLLMRRQERTGQTILLKWHYTS